jgi:hypothetical protein
MLLDTTVALRRGIGNSPPLLDRCGTAGDLPGWAARLGSVGGYESVDLDTVFLVSSTVLNIITGALTTGDCDGAVDELVGRRAEVIIPARAAGADAQAQIIERYAEAHELLDLLLELSAAVVDRAHSAERGLRPTLLGNIYAGGRIAAREVLTLLRTGHATGALARWRAVHELTTHAEFLSRFGEAISGTLERYDAHDKLFREYRSLRLYQAWISRLHPVLDDPSDELRSLESERELLKRRFGEPFLGDHGWAHDALLEISGDYRRQIEKGKRLRGPVFGDLDRCSL